MPSFIDIGVWDYTTEYTPEKDKRLQEIRVELMDELSRMISEDKFPYWKYQVLFFKPGCGQIISEQCLHPDNQNVEQATIESQKIESVFSKYIRKAIDEKILLPTDAGDKAKSYAYSLDNLLMPGRQMLFPKGTIHPTIRLPYENLTVECPNDSKAFLDTCYSDWPLIPDDDSLLARRHFDKAILDRPEVKKAIEKFLKQLVATHSRYGEVDVLLYLRLFIGRVMVYSAYTVNGHKYQCAPQNASNNNYNCPGDSRSDF